MIKDDTSATFTFRLPEDLKKAFDVSAAGQDQTSSQLLRAFIREYVKKHAQQRLV